MDKSWRNGSYILLVWLFAAGCTEKKSPYYGTTVPRHGPDEIWTNNGSEPEWIDPNKSSGSAGGVVIRNIFAALTQLHPKTLEVMPDVAKGWTISDDGKTYIFHLRRSVWSDGSPLTAHDFVYSWRRLLDPKTASKYASFLHVLKNGEAFSKGTVDATAVGIKALDALTLEVQLVNPLPFFLDMVSFYVTMPVPRHAIEALSAAGKDPELWTRPEYIVSNGAYLLKKWRFRQYMIFEKNDLYWDAKKTRTKRIRLGMVESANTSLNLYEAGEYDYIG